jgi:hypothetical protein
LADNGFSSPLCREPQLRQQLSARQRAACAASGTPAAGAPIGDYDFDVHIDSGVTNPKGTVTAAFQDYALKLEWTAIVWLIHALTIALDWAYSLDLLGGSRMGTVARTLHHAEAAFTGPWLAPVLAAAAIATAYRGLVQRRVSETLNAVASMALLMIAALGLLADPDGTVGEASRWVNQAALGSLAAISGGSPQRPQRTLADGMGAVFEGAVSSPWCYLEFGNVAWCQDPRRLDPRLRLAARRIARAELIVADCRVQSTARLSCDTGRVAGDEGARREVAGVRQARTNGELFLAFPANGPERNSINDPNSLLRTLCNSDDATHCRGPTAAQAEFRTGQGTLARAGGLLLIGVGAAGMLALLAYLAIRLVGAALLVLLYLLVTPLAVLAPALGETGRAAFRAWGVRLLGALVAKLVYSVFLGSVLLAARVLGQLDALGWWTQWVLFAALWWIAYQNRHALLGLALVNHRGSAQHAPFARVASRGRTHLLQHARLLPKILRPISEKVRERYFPKQRSPEDGDPKDGDPSAPTDRGSVDPVGEDRGGPPPLIARRERTPVAARARAAAERTSVRRRQAALLLAHRRKDAEGAGKAHRSRRAAALRDQLSRVRREHSRAHAAGERRRALRLASRAARLQGDLATVEGNLISARPTRGAGWRPSRLAELRRANAELGAQAALAPGGSVRRSSDARDYPRLAALLGMSAAAYRGLDPASSRRARLEIDRQLERRASRPDEAPARGAPVSPGGLFDGPSPKRSWQLGPAPSAARQARSGPDPADARRARTRQFGSVERPHPPSSRSPRS